MPSSESKPLPKATTVFQPASHWVHTHTKLVLTLFTLLGILISSAVFLSSHYSMMTETRSDDAWTIAMRLYHGQGYTACSTSYFPFCRTTSQVTAEREPLPTLMFLGAMMVNPSRAAGFMLEIILYMGVFYILYFTLRDESRLLALGTGLLWLVSIPVIKEIGNGSGDLEAAFWMAPGMLFFQKARTTHRYLHWALAGVFLGLAALSRTIISGLAIGLAFGLLLETALGHFKLRLRQMFAFFSTFVLLLSPWVTRNQMAFGAPVFSSTLAGYNLYRHNYILAEPNYYPHYVGAREARLAIKDLVQNPELRGNENELQMESFYLHEAWKVIWSHPAEYAGLVAFRFLTLWFDASVKAGYGEPMDVLDALEVIQQMFILALTIGAALLFPKKLWPYTLAVCLTTIAYMIVGAQVRYLIEVMPLIVTLAGWGLFSRIGRSTAG